MHCCWGAGQKDPGRHGSEGGGPPHKSDNNANMTPSRCVCFALKIGGWHPFVLRQLNAGTAGMLELGRYSGGWQVTTIRVLHHKMVLDGETNVEILVKTSAVERTQGQKTKIT